MYFLMKWFSTLVFLVISFFIRDLYNAVSYFFVSGCKNSIVCKLQLGNDGWVGFLLLKYARDNFVVCFM